MKKKTKGIVIGTALAGISAIAGGVSLITKKINKFVAQTALDRKEPKQMIGTKNPMDTIVPEDMKEEIFACVEKFKNSDLKTVEITASDGEKLVGHFHHKDGNKRLIIAMHGWRSAWYKDFSAISDFWHSEGCSVLYAEQRGQGMSGGEYMGFGMIERHDCLDWINWALDETDGKIPIYLAGASMGATTVLMAGGFDLPQNVRGIMADCGFTSAHAIWKHVVEENTPFSYDYMEKAVDDLCKQKIHVGLDDYTTLDAMETCKTPILFVHGKKDTFVPVEMTYENYRACKAPKTLFIVDDATHAMSYMFDKRGYENVVKNFWEMYD